MAAVDVIEALKETGYLEAFAADLNRLRSEGDLHDVTLLVEGKKFPAHKIVLAAASAYFKTMFTTDVKEKSQAEISLVLTPECAKSGVFEVVLEFIYSGKLQLSEDNCFDVLILGCYLQVKSLPQICSSYIDQAYREKRLQFENPLRIFHIAANYNVPELKDAALAHMAPDFIEVSKTEDFLDEMTHDLLIQLLGRIDLAVSSEEKILDAVIRWLKHDWDARKTYAWAVLQKVRLGLIPIHKLRDKFTNELKEDQNCMAAYCELLEFGTIKGIERGPMLQTLDGLFKPRNTRTTILAVGEKSSSYYCEDENVWKTSPIPGAAGSSAIVINDHLYIVGNSGTFSQYDPSTNKWISKPSKQMRQTNLTTAYHNNYLYVVDTSKCAERYNFATQRWQYISCLPLSFKTRPSAVAYKDKIFVVGVTSMKDSTAHEMKMISFDPQTNSWTEIGTMKNKGVPKVQVVVVEDTLYSVQTGRSRDEIGWFPRSVVTRHEPPVLENEREGNTMIDTGDDNNKCTTKGEGSENDSEGQRLEFSQKVVSQRLAGRGTIPSFQIGNQLYLAINDYIHNPGITPAEDRVYDPDLSSWSQLAKIDDAASVVYFTSSSTANSAMED